MHCKNGKMATEDLMLLKIVLQILEQTILSLKFLSSSLH